MREIADDLLGLSAPDGEIERHRRFLSDAVAVKHRHDKIKIRDSRLRREQGGTPPLHPPPRRARPRYPNLWHRQGVPHAGTQDTEHLDKRFTLSGAGRHESRHW